MHFNKKFKKNRVHENLSEAKNFYFMPRDLYEDILKNMDHDEIISLLGHADLYNSDFKHYKDTHPEIVWIDKESIYKSVLQTKRVDFIASAIMFMLELFKKNPTYEIITIDFLENCGDNEFIYDFICKVPFNWNSYIKNLKSLIAKVGSLQEIVVIWNFIIKNKFNPKTVVMLLEEERYRTLKVMYFISKIKKIASYEIDVMYHYLVLHKEEVKTIDEKFYRKYGLDKFEAEIDYKEVVEKVLFAQQKHDDIQMSFDELNKHDFDSDEVDFVNQQELEEDAKIEDIILKLINFLNNSQLDIDELRELINSYLRLYSKKVKEVDEAFYNRRVEYLLTMDLIEVIDKILENYSNMFLNYSTQTCFEDFESEEERYEKYVSFLIKQG